jgi:RND family efflux transporter MFP subunit
MTEQIFKPEPNSQPAEKPYVSTDLHISPCPLPPATPQETAIPEQTSVPTPVRRKSIAGGFGLNRLDWRIFSVIGLALIAIPVWRTTTGHAKQAIATAPAVPVAITKVTREDLAQELVCDAELRPYQEVELHSKVAGFLKNITVDIGDRVEAGQLLATIEVPELGDDIKRANAALNRNEQEVARAQAAYEDAHLVYNRLASVDKAQPNLIAQQELDAALEKDQTASSSLAAVKAEVEVSHAEIAKLKTMLSYSRILAPFPGVITKRYADPGALIQAGISSSTQALPLVRLSQNDKLRLDIPLSVSYVARIKTGDPVEVRVESCNKSFTGKIARSTRKVETATRTMEVEVDVPNPDLQLIPGMYASVSLRSAFREKTLAVPIEAVSRQKSSTVFVINNQNKIEERSVTVGLETSDKLEILTGLSENERIMIGSRAQVRPGQVVDPKVITERNTLE